MQVSDMTFGVEIETTLPAGSIQVGGYHRGVQVPGLPIGWNAQHDGSISTRSRRVRMGAEIVSPVLSGENGLLQIIEVCRTLKAMGAKVNTSTGLHVHVGFDKSDTSAKTRLVTMSSNFEKAIYASTGTKRRERGGYCAPIQRHGSVETYESYGVRYHIVNVFTNGPTVEFRAFAGTLNATKIVGYVRLCLGIVQRSVAAKRVTNWVAPTPVETSPIHRDGVGQTELTRLFYQLGWTKGRRNVAYGWIEGATLPDLKSTKRLMMKMARKYDAMA